MSFANLPLLWLFGGRNNIFLWATGWSFASFNIFHRHVARVATVQAIVHSILYVVIFIQSKYWPLDLLVQARVLTVENYSGQSLERDVQDVCFMGHFGRLPIWLISS